EGVLMARTIIPVGRLQVATPVTMATAIRANTEATDAVDDRIQGVAADIIANDPTIIAAAEAAAADAVADEIQEIGAVVGLPTDAPPRSSRSTLPVSWSNRVFSDPYGDAYADQYSGTWSTQTRQQGDVPLLNSLGALLRSMMPTGTVFSDGTVPFTAVNLGESVGLREVRGARGHRLQYISRQPTNENARPY